MNGKDIINRMNTRKERREEKIYGSFLISLSTQYYQYKEENEGFPEMVKDMFKAQNHKWVQFVHKWDNNPQRISRIRREDFANIIIKKDIEDAKDKEK